jgi:hypothetical protein
METRTPEKQDLTDPHAEEKGDGQKNGAECGKT